MVAIGVYFNSPGTSLDQYDEVCRRMNNGQPLRSLSDWPVGGCLAHSAWQEGDSLSVFGVWESAAAFQRFGDQLLPLTQEVGLPQSEPQIAPLHNFVKS
jgi:hypothetical protein